MFCRNCGKQLDDNALFCMNCGVKISDSTSSKYCAQCGTELESDASFCMNCGNRVREEQTQTIEENNIESANVEDRASEIDDKKTGLRNEFIKDISQNNEKSEKIAEIRQKAVSLDNFSQSKKTIGRSIGIIVVALSLICAGAFFILQNQNKKLWSSDKELLAKAWDALALRNDYKEAVELYSRLAEKNNQEAQYWLGVMYHFGDGLPEDFEKAKYWYEKSAMQGNAKAMENLGGMYEYGEGVPQSDVLSKVWYEKAIKAYEYAGENGDAEAQCKLGGIFYAGPENSRYSIVDKADLSKAIYWYTKAANQDHPLALIELAGMYDDGYGIKSDKEKSKKLYAKAIAVLEKSAMAGNSYHQRLLGDIYAGNFTFYFVDIAKAKYWYEKAAKNGNLVAIEALKEF